MAFKLNDETFKDMMPRRDPMPWGITRDSSRSLSEESNVPPRKKKPFSPLRPKAKTNPSSSAIETPRKIKTLELENKKLERLVRSQKVELASLKESNDKARADNTNLVNEIRSMKKQLTHINSRLNKSLEGFDKKRLPGGSATIASSKKRDSHLKRVATLEKPRVTTENDMDTNRKPSMFEYNDGEEEDDEEDYDDFFKEMGLNQTSKDEQLLIDTASPDPSVEGRSKNFNDILHKMEKISDRGSFVEPVTPLNTEGEKDLARKKRISDRLFTFKRSLNDEREAKNYTVATRPLLNDRTVNSLFEDVKDRDNH